MQACKTRIGFRRSKQTSRPTPCEVFGGSFKRADRAITSPTHRGDTRHPWRTVNEHRAAAALPLRAAPILDRGEPEIVTQDVK